MSGTDDDETVDGSGTVDNGDTTECSDDAADPSTDFESEYPGAFDALDPIVTEEPTDAVADHDRTPEFES
ncbi:hypothetical protein RYH80_06500 [Halobaculum sp. MBLA0147]|uniref:hypothetical protein n=1 Tax=Halobaculum sp. MBLA0147 TaxID=3079934 RepID=UPI003523FFFD